MYIISFVGKAIQHFTKDYEHHESQRRRVKQEVIRTSITAPRIVKFRKGGLLPLIYSNILFPFFSHVTYNETKHILGYDEIIIGVEKERYLKGGFSKSKIQIQESIKIWAQKCAHRTTVTSTIKIFPIWINLQSLPWVPCYEWMWDMETFVSCTANQPLTFFDAGLPFI